MREFSRLEVIVAAVVFALAALATWYLWLGQVWDVLALPRLHHWVYGTVFIGVSIGLNLWARYKRAGYFFIVVGLIWFMDDFQDFVGVFSFLS